jgi:fatty-acyl-CoA synthase
MYHHRGAYLNALGEALEHGLNYTSVYLWTLPMFHCNGWCFTWAVTAVGATNVCLRKVVPEEIFRLIERENVSHLCAAPTILVSMSNYVGTQEVRTKRQLEIITAGAPPAPTVIANIELTGANVTQVYGLTESYGPHSICSPQAEWVSLTPKERAQLKARQGVPNIPARYMDSIDPITMKPVPWDGETLGEIVMRGNNVMLGYYKDNQATEEAFKGGWFHSGDLAVIHPNGYFEIKDRSKDVIISGGENISSVEVENVIYRHPDVAEVAVVSAPDSKWGEVPKAFVTLKPGAKTSAEDLINFCRENMARFKVPKHIEFRELPKTATGKILKYELRNKEWEGREKKVN